MKEWIEDLLPEDWICIDEGDNNLLFAKDSTSIYITMSGTFYSISIATTEKQELRIRFAEDEDELEDIIDEITQ